MKLRDNFDRLRDESRDERDRRDTRSYYFDEGEPGFERDSSARRDYERDERRIARDDYGEPESRSYFVDRESSNRRDTDQNPAGYTRDTTHHWTESRSSTANDLYAPPSSRISENDRAPDRFGNQIEHRRDDLREAPRESIERITTAQNQRLLQRQNNQTQNSQTQFAGDFSQRVEEPKRNLGERYFSERYGDNRGANNRAELVRHEQRQTGTARARDVMSRNVATVAPHDSAQHAARLMRDCDCGAIPVVERHGRMLGMITDRDIAVRLVASGRDARAAAVQDAMTTEVFAVHENDLFDDLVRQMREHQIRRLVVVDDQSRVVGIISQGDLARHAQRNQGEHDELTNMLGEISEPTRNPYR